MFTGPPTKYGVMEKGNWNKPLGNHRKERNWKPSRFIDISPEVTLWEEPLGAP